VKTNNSITGKVKYLANKEGAAVYRVGENNQQDTQHFGNFVLQPVEIYDARLQPEPFTLDMQGFTLVDQPSRVSNFYDDRELASVYDDEAKATVLKATGARRVEIFDHTRRSSSTQVRSDHDVREPASIIHNDYSDASGVARLKAHFAGSDEDVGALLAGRFAIVNVWRSINGSILQKPLTLCDAQTTQPSDLVAVKREAKERTGELQQALFNPQHRWYYYPEMKIDEALLIKTYDSSQQGETRFTLHTAFDLPDSNPDTPGRESLETRCFVFY